MLIVFMFHNRLMLMHDAYDHRLDLAGISLSRISEVAYVKDDWDDIKGETLHIDESVSHFLYPWPGTRGYSPKADIWTSFLIWVEKYVIHVCLYCGMLGSTTECVIYICDMLIQYFIALFLYTPYYVKQESRRPKV